MTFLPKGILAGAAVAATVLAATAASADVLVAVAKQTASSGTNVAFVPLALDDAGHTAVRFATTAARTRLVFTFNGSCREDGPIGTAVKLRLQVDNTTNAAPDNFTICQATSASAAPVGAVYQSVLIVPAGNHVVRVLVGQTGSANTGPWNFFQSSLAVQR